MRAHTAWIWGAAILLGVLAGGLSTCLNHQEAPPEIPDPRIALAQQPAQIWRRYSRAPAVDAFLQPYGAMVTDTLKGRLLLFGSDPLGEFQDNSVREFDPWLKRWSQHATASPLSSYRPDGRGRAIAGHQEIAPWALYTHASLVYDPYLDALVLAGRPSSAAEQLRMPGVREHPAWLYNLRQREWQILMTAETIQAVPLQDAVATYDPRRNRILAYADGLWALDRRREVWRQLNDTHLPITAHDLVYHPEADQLLLFGSAGNRQSGLLTLWRYQPGADEKHATGWLALDLEPEHLGSCDLKQPVSVAYVPAHATLERAALVLVGLSTARRHGAGDPLASTPAGQPEAAIITCLLDPDTLQLSPLPVTNLDSPTRQLQLVWHPQLQVLFLLSGDGRQPLQVWSMRLDAS